MDPCPGTPQKEPIVDESSVPQEEGLFHSENQVARLSKFMSYLLRHNPQKLCLSLDRRGSAPLSALVAALACRFTWVTVEHVKHIVESSGKRRFEIVDGRIRAVYGHSIPVELDAQEAEPPETLYHGTAPGSVDEIKVFGLKPMGRQYVHLSRTIEDAAQVGRRREPDAMVLKIDAKEAYEGGVKFASVGDLFLTKEVPPEYIGVVPSEELPELPPMPEEPDDEELEDDASDSAADPEEGEEAAAQPDENELGEEGGAEPGSGS